MHAGISNALFSSGGGEMDDRQIDSPNLKIYEKPVMRCSFGIINAERNSA